MLHESFCCFVKANFLKNKFGQKMIEKLRKHSKQKMRWLKRCGDERHEQIFLLLKLENWPIFSWFLHHRAFSFCSFFCSFFLLFLNLLSDFIVFPIYYLTSTLICFTLSYFLCFTSTSVCYVHWVPFVCREQNRQM